MSGFPPIWFQWDGESMVPKSASAADQYFIIGQTYRLGEIEERSEISHNHQFAFLKTAWDSLPERMRTEYPSVEALRKRGLIATGFYSVQDYACGSKAEAARWADFLKREVEEYALVVPSESVVRVFRARSQKRSAMNKADFQASKDALMEWVSGLLEVAPGLLAEAAGKAA